MYSIERMAKSDFDVILRDLDDFWGVRTDHLFCLHHPVMLYEFGDSAFVARGEGGVLGYLLGFFAQTGPVGYVHLIAVRRAWRRKGIGQALYARFERHAHDHGARALKAVTPPGNRASIEFHRSLGMRLLGPPDAAGLPVVRDYWGLGTDRVVFWKELAANGEVWPEFGNKQTGAHPVA